jgi:hypothetical protein
MGGFVGGLNGGSNKNKEQAKEEREKCIDIFYSEKYF